MLILHQTSSFAIVAAVIDMFAEVAATGTRADPVVFYFGCNRVKFIQQFEVCSIAAMSAKSIN